MSALANWLIQKADFLESSQSYSDKKKLAYDIIENEYSPYRTWVDTFLGICVMVSVGIYIYDIRKYLYDYISPSAYIFSAIFAIEYILRLWVSSDSAAEIIELRNRKKTIGKIPTTFEIIWIPLKKKIIWTSRVTNMIDFISIFPQFRILRLFRLFRYTRGGRNLFSVFQDRRQEFSILVVLIFIAVMIAASLFYYFERHNNKVTDFFDAIYWAVITITTVGYGDIAPSTTEGKVLAMFLVFGGLGVIAMLTSIVTAGLTQKMQLIKQQKTLEFVEKSKSFIVIVGFCRISEDLCKMLTSNVTDFVIIEKSEEKAKKAYDMDYKVIIGDATHYGILLQASVDLKATAVVCLAGDDVTSIALTISIRSLGSKALIISRCVEAQNNVKMKTAGVDLIIDHYLIAVILSKCLDAPLVYQAISSMSFSMNNNSFNFKEIVVLAPDLVSLEDIAKSCIIIGIFRGEEFYLNPNVLSFELETADIIVVFGSLTDIARINRYLQGKSLWRKF